MATSASVVGHDEVAALKTVALRGGLDEPVKVSCAALGDRIGASSQTASRRLQRLEEAGFVERDVVSDGQWISITGDGERRLRAEYADYRRVFEGRADLALAGNVTGGMGEGRHYISLSGYMRQFRDRLGYEPFPGTLNVELTDASIRSRAGLDSLEGVPIDGWEDDERTFGPATCYPATVLAGADVSLDASGGWNGDDAVASDPEADDAETYEPAHVIVPERTHHDEAQLEVIAPEKLRDVLGLADGDAIGIRVRDAAPRATRRTGDDGGTSE